MAGTRTHKYDVFLSYSRKDESLMRRVRDNLEARDILVWTDQNLEPGTRSWKAAIEEAIEDAACIVVVLSPDAKNSEWIERELTYAQAFDKTVIPILVRGGEQEAVPIELINAQRIDARSNLEDALRRLVMAVKHHLGVAGRDTESVEAAPRPSVADIADSIPPFTPKPFKLAQASLEDYGSPKRKEIAKALSDSMDFKLRSQRSRAAIVGKVSVTYLVRKSESASQGEDVGWFLGMAPESSQSVHVPTSDQRSAMNDLGWRELGLTFVRNYRPGTDLAQIVENIVAVNNVFSVSETQIKIRLAEPDQDP